MPGPAASIDEDSARQWGHWRTTFFQASFGAGYYYATGRSDWAGEYAAVPTLTTSANASNVPEANNYDPNMEFRLVMPVVSWRLSTDLMYPPPDTEPKTVNASLDSQMSFGLSETGVRAWSGLSGFRYAQNPERWRESRIALATVPAIETGPDDLVYDTYVVATSCCVQAGDHIDSGFLVGRFRAPRTIEEEPGPLRQATAMWGNIQRLSANVDPDVRPQLNPATGAYRRNTIYDLGLLETDTAIILVASCAVASVDGGGSPLLTTATQIYRFDRESGAATATTEYKAVLTDTVQGLRRITHCLNQVRYQVGDVPRTGLAALRFDVTDEVDTASVELVLYDEDGNALITGLRSAGYVPFWPKLQGAYSIWSYADNLDYYAAPQPSVARYLGGGRIGVLAAETSQVAAGGATEWRLVVLDAATLAVIDVRGVVATLPAGTFIGAYFSVVEPETVGDEGETLAPAILMGFEGHFVGAPGSQSYSHKLSRDGGQTWHTVFTGTNWPLVYMGNGLHPVSLI